jgi:DNA-binding transcriptional LysR family regulator
VSSLKFTSRIRRLEEDLRVTLFIREGKRLHLAPAGQVLLGYAERLLALADEARGAVHDKRPRGTFRLGAMESTAAVRLPGLLSEDHRRHPGVVLELRTGQSGRAGQRDPGRRIRRRAAVRADRGPAVREDVRV